MPRDREATGGVKNDRVVRYGSAARPAAGTTRTGTRAPPARGPPPRPPEEGSVRPISSC